MQPKSQHTAKLLEENLTIKGALMKLRFIAIPLLLMCVAVALAQTAKTSGNNSPVSQDNKGSISYNDAHAPTLTPAEENSILKAQHETDALTGQIKDMQAQFAQLQAQAQQLQQKFPQVQQQLKDAEKKLDTAVDTVYKDHGVTKDKMDFDRATLKFKEKAEVKK